MTGVANMLIFVGLAAFLLSLPMALIDGWCGTDEGEFGQIGCLGLLLALAGGFVKLTLYVF